MGMPRERPHPTRLTVGHRFEPNRLAPQSLADAYQTVAPISRRPMGAEPRRSPILLAVGEARGKEAA
jgi:hypothetical protein